MKVSQKIKIGILCIASLCVCYTSVEAQTIPSDDIDSLVQRAMETFDVPGIAVAVIEDGETVHRKGYGRRSNHSQAKVDEHTLFAIASNSKAFTCAALGILIDENKISGWDDKVKTYIPEFQLYSPYVSAEFTIRDLLTHRSGLGLGAGDLMIYPDGNDYTIEELIDNLRYLQPVSGFRSEYAYDNLLYIVAGEIISRVSGMSWAAFIEKQIMKPLGMERSVGTVQRLKATSNRIDPHAMVNGKLQVIDRYDLKLTAAAGGIYSSVADLSKWVRMQLNHGRYGDGKSKRLLSENVHREMWTPQTIIHSGIGGRYNTHFNNYGLGFRLSDVSGSLQVSHTGGLPGMVTQVTMLPELKVGIIVLTNQQSREAMVSITDEIKDAFLGLKDIDHIQRNVQNYRRMKSNEQKETQEVRDKIEERQEASATREKDYSKYVGTYKDNWFGEVVIKLKNNKLRFESKRSPRLAGEMVWYAGNTFVVKWDDRSLEADAFALFELDFEGRPSGMKMKAVSPLTDFSYDFHDLDFYRIND